MANIDMDKVVGVLNRILEAELAGVVRYTHYSFLVFGFGRIPIVSWLRDQANESLLHAQHVGEWITSDRRLSLTDHRPPPRLAQTRHRGARGLSASTASSRRRLR